MTSTLAPPLPRRHPSVAPDIALAVEHARILRGAGDPSGAARVLDVAFAAEGVRARPVSERIRFTALVLRADLALHLHDDVGAARFLAGADALVHLANALESLVDNRGRVL